MDDLTLGQLRRVNVARCEEVFHPLMSWTPNDWATALAGETGELCNLLKKLRRGDQPSIADIEDEVADVLIYLDLLAARLGIDVAKAVTRKFNQVSRARGSAFVLARDPEAGIDAHADVITPPARRGLE